MIQILADGVVTYDSRLDEYCLQALRVTGGLKKGGTAEIVMPPHHPAYSSYTGYRTVVEIYRDGVLRFRGRALYPVDDFNNTRNVVCEGELCFLQDAVSRPYLYQDTPKHIFTDVVGEYNAQVEPFKQFKVGTVTVTDPNDYIRLESEDAETVLATIEKLTERCGGYVVFTTDSTGARVINWLDQVGTNNRQTIEAGENLLDFQRSGANTDLATALVPYGAKDEKTGKRVTIASVNGGKDYIKDETAVAIRGTITKTATWDDVTDPQNLLRKARQYLNECKLFVTSLTLSALDLSYIDKSIESFKLGDLIRVITRAHGVDEDFQLVETSEDLLNPAASTITLGKEIRTLTNLDVAGDGKSRNELQQTAAAIKKDFDINVQKSVEAAMQSDATRETLTSIISQQAGDIALEVSGSLGSKAAIKLSAFGAVQTAELDLENIRRAFADDRSAVVIEGGTIAFNSNTLIVNSTNLQVTEDGTIKATNAELTGTATTENGLYKSELSGGRLRFFYGDTEYGGIASGYMDGNESVRGVTVRLSDAALYMGFSRLNTETGLYDLYYGINFGANVGGRTERHLFFGSAYFSGGVNITGAVDVTGSATLRGAAYFYNNAIFTAAATFSTTTTFNGAVVCNANAFFANGKGVVLYRSDGKTVFSLTIDASDRMYIGSQDVAVYVVGSSVQVGASSYPTTITGSSVAISNSVTVAGAATFSNGYGIRIKDSVGTAQYVLSMTNSDQVNVGHLDYALNLRGDSVTVPYGNVTLALGSVALSNGYGLIIKDSAGAQHYVLSLTAGNQVNVGAASYVTYLRGTAVYLASSGAAVTSDERKKNSIEPLPDAYEAMLDKLTPVRYKYNDGTSGRFHAGFIAQEVQEALEAAGLTSQDFGGFVDINKDGEELGLIYSEFIALLLLKIKRQEQRIAALEAVQ